jgi:hypothetical protein
MSAQEKVVQAKWWSLQVPEKWQVEDFRGGKNIYPNGDAKLEVICLKKEFEEALIFDLKKYFGKLALSCGPKNIGERIWIYAQDQTKLDKVFKWGIVLNQFIFLATYSTKSETNDKVISSIEDCLKNVKFFGGIGP